MLPFQNNTSDLNNPLPSPDHMVSPTSVTFSVPSFESISPMDNKSDSASIGKSRSGRKGNSAAKRKHESDLKKAIVLVVMNDYSLRQAATAAGVSHETLRRRLQSLKSRTDVNKRANIHLGQKQNSRDEYASSINIHQKSHQLSHESHYRNDTNYNLAPTTQQLPSSAVAASSHGSDDLYNSKQVSKVLGSIDSFEKLISKEFFFETPEHQKRLCEEFFKVKSSVMNYVDHSVESLQTARAMVLEEIEYNEHNLVTNVNSNVYNTHNSSTSSTNNNIPSNPCEYPTNTKEWIMTQSTESVYQPRSNIPESRSPIITQSYQHAQNPAAAISSQILMSTVPAQKPPKISKIGSIDSLIHNENIEDYNHNNKYTNNNINRYPSFVSNNASHDKYTGYSSHLSNSGNRPALPPPSKKSSQVSIMALLTEDE